MSANAVIFNLFWALDPFADPTKHRFQQRGRVVVEKQAHKNPGSYINTKCVYDIFN
jgi:hypothetical protein